MRAGNGLDRVMDVSLLGKETATLTVNWTWRGQACFSVETWSRAACDPATPDQLNRSALRRPGNSLAHTPVAASAPKPPNRAAPTGPRIRTAKPV